MCSTPELPKLSGNSDIGGQTTQKKALPKQSLFDSKGIAWLGGNHVVGTRPFLALSDFKRDFLAFIEAGIALRLDFRMVDEQIVRSVLRSDETKSLACIEPLHCTCTHCTTPWPVLGRLTVPLD